jgi:hypothetical protein
MFKFTSQTAAFKKSKVDELVRLELLNVMDKVGRGMKRDFDATTMTWKVRPTFKYTKHLSRKAIEGYINMEVSVETSDLLYVWLNYGTKEHVVSPKTMNLNMGGGIKAKIVWAPANRWNPDPEKNNYLRTNRSRGSYDPKIHGALTIPSSGGVLLRASATIPEYPGNHWDLVIADKWDNKFADMVDEAFIVALSKSFGR